MITEPTWSLRSEGVVPEPFPATKPEVDITACGQWIGVGTAWGWYDLKTEKILVVAGVTPEGWLKLAVVGHGDWLDVVAGRWQPLDEESSQPGVGGT